MTGPWPLRVQCCLLLLVTLAAGSHGQAQGPSQQTCRAVILYIDRLEHTINGYREIMATDRLRMSSWAEAEHHYSETPWLYYDFNYLKRVPLSFSSALPYIDHLRFCSELLRSYQFALDQVQLDLSLYPERNNIHIKKSTHIALNLERLQNAIQQEATRAKIPVNLSDMNYMLAAAYIPVTANDKRKERHFLTLFEIMNGTTYIKQMFENC